MSEQLTLEKKDRFAAARAAKAAKKEAARLAAEKAQELGITELASATDLDEDNAMSMEEQVWLTGLTSAMRSREVKAAGDVALCVPVADAVLKAFKEKFPE